MDVCTRVRLIIYTYEKVSKLLILWWCYNVILTGQKPPPLFVASLEYPLFRFLQIASINSTIYVLYSASYAIVEHIWLQFHLCGHIRNHRYMDSSICVCCISKVKVKEKAQCFQQNKKDWHTHLQIRKRSSLVDAK